MDENNYMMGIIGNSKMMFSKYQEQRFINQSSKQELTWLIETTGITGCWLLLFVLLKCKKKKMIDILAI